MSGATLTTSSSPHRRAKQARLNGRADPDLLSQLLIEGAESGMISPAPSRPALWNMKSQNLPYYRVTRGKGRCWPSDKMKRNGFAGLECGPDGPEARAKATAWYESWLDINKELKNPSSESADAGYIVFSRTTSHLNIRYAKQQTSKFVLDRMSHGEAFNSMLIVRGSQQKADYLHQKLSSFKTSAGFSLSPEVLAELRSAAEMQGVEVPDQVSALTAGSHREAPRKLPGRRHAYTTDVSDAQWHQISPILTADYDELQSFRSPSRDTINAIVHHLRSGHPWTRLPKHMPDHTKVRVTYNNLVRQGKWDKIAAVLRA